MDTYAAVETKRHAGIMPMLLLCVFTALGLFSGLLDDGGRQAVLPDFASAADAEAQQSTPVVPKRPLAAAEWRVGKATAPYDDGKSKLLLVSSGPQLFLSSNRSARGPGAVRQAATASSHDYRARAPPASARRLHIGAAA